MQGLAIAKDDGAGSATAVGFALEVEKLALPNHHRGAVLSVEGVVEVAGGADSDHAGGILALDDAPLDHGSITHHNIHVIRPQGRKGNECEQRPDERGSNLHGSSWLRV